MPTIRIVIPALDRLLDYLEGIDQAQIDAIADDINTLAAKLTTSESTLKESIQNGQLR